eukprot:3835187-Pyramimonas_sp.AAC.1
MVNFAFRKHRDTQAQSRNNKSSVLGPIIKDLCARCFTDAWGANRPSRGSRNDAATIIERAFAAASSTLRTRPA